MAAMVEVKAEVDAQMRDDAAAILAKSGLTVADAISMALARTVLEGSPGYPPLNPNEETQDAMRAARRGEGKSFDTIEALMADLHADN